ncbi:hypothetical protein N9S87_01095, partial [Synechococcus sp. AH-779-G23]|nr:hypothetical protein [Synechococcus sp. AH-779-G23]
NAYYRLRSYKNPPKSNQLDNGEAKFIIEGIVRRKSMPEGQYLARARLERSLKVEAAVLKKRENDWAILFAKNYDLGNTSITGSGLIVWEVSEENAKTISKDCKTSNLLRHISNNAYQRIHERIWPVTNQILKNDSTRNLFQINKNIDIRASSGQKRIWRIDDTNSYQTGWPNYGNNSVCKRSRWRGLFPICERIDDGSDPTFQEDYYSVVKNVWDFYRQPEKYAGWEIVLSQEEFCPAQTGDCHIYIEHLNLQDSKLYIENDKRPVILHLITPNKDSSQISGSNGTFQIAGTARICGVDQGQSKCNQKPERLIIMSDHDIKNPDAESTCISSTYPLKIEGNSLPHAFILLRQGTVELTASTTMNGAIWSRNICANRNNLNVSVPSNFIETVYDLWEWRSKNFSGFGRSVSRAIRGSGYDTFQRF